MTYNINYDVQYNDNQKFRQDLRNVFSMNCIEDENNHLMDDETRDELLYDDKQVSQSLTFILQQTDKLPLFIDLYQITAARVFSTDLGIGLSILFSYDNFYLFHLLLRDFFNDSSSLNSNTQSYINLKKHII